MLDDDLGVPGRGGPDPDGSSRRQAGAERSLAVVPTLASDVRWVRKDIAHSDVGGSRTRLYVQATVGPLGANHRDLESLGVWQIGDQANVQVRKAFQDRGHDLMNVD